MISSTPDWARSRRAVPLTAALALTLTGVAVPLALAPAAHGADPAPEQIVNGSFDTDTSGWTNYPSPSWDPAGGKACIDVPAGSGAYSAAISQKPIPMVNGETYTLSFTASADAPTGSIRAVIQGGPEANYAQALPEKQLSLTAAPQTFTYTFTDSVDLPAGGELAFQQNVANTAAYRLCVDDVSLRGGAAPPVYTPDTGPRVRVNQVGYLTDGPKAATLVTDATTAVPWQLKSSGGTVVASGSSTPQGVDPSAGLNVQTIDFGSYATAGTGYTLVADGETSYPFSIGANLYDQLRKDSKTFFYTNRSGIAIDNAIAPGYGRAAGHVGVAPNTGDTAVPCLPLGDDAQKVYVKQGTEPWTCSGTRDVTGGWYDAGDHGKYVVNGGISVAQLMQEFERTKNAPTATSAALGDSTLRVPEQGNQVPDLLDEARWELDWLLKMQVPAGQQYAGLAYHKVADLDWTGLPLAPAADPQPRALFRPSTAAGLNLAAAAAQGARLFAPYDKAYADRLLAAARTAYTAARATPALYAPAPDAALDPSPGSGPYDDTDVSDEFYWAGAELYLTTGESSYRADVLASPQNTAAIFTPAGFDWGHVSAMARLDLATVPNSLPGRAAVKQSVLAAADAYLADENQPFGQAYAPTGGNYAWGSNSAILANMQVIGTAYDLSGAAKYRNGVATSMDYLLGRNALNQSYVTGYGTKYSQNQHTRLYSHELDPSLPNPPAGTIAGGPNSTTASTGDPVATPLFKNGCAAQFCYVDDIGSWSTNEITINWNAPLSWVSSFLADQKSGAAPAAATCKVSYTTYASWPGGFITQVWLKNTGRTPIKGWTASWSFLAGQSVANIWAASSTQSGATVTARNLSWDSTIAPGRSVTFGFLGKSSPGYANPDPERFVVNGQVCTTA